MHHLRYAVHAAAAALVLLASAAFAAPPAQADTTQTNGNGTATDVGAWFVTYNNASQFSNNFGQGFPIKYRPLDENGQYSIPDSSDTALMDYYIQQLASAGVDFLLFDETNGGLPGTSYYQSNASIVHNAELMMGRMKAWNDAHSWKIRFAFAVGTYGAMCGSDGAGACAENQAASVLTNYVNGTAYDGTDYYYRVNGKPLLVLYNFDDNDPAQTQANYTGTKTASDQFTIRGANNGQNGQYGWQTGSGFQQNSEIELVSPGWRPHHTQPGYSRDNGKYYTAEWNQVLDHPHPRIVMIQAFNDFNEDSAIWTTDTSMCDPNYEEPWSGPDGTLHPSMYWDQTVAAIRELRTPNLATGAGTDASSTYGGLPASNAVDGLNGTVYSSQVGVKVDHTESLNVNFSSPQTFNRIDLVSRGDGAYGFPKSFTLQVWNGSEWLTRVSVSNFTTPPAGSISSFSWGFSDYSIAVRIVATHLGQDDNGDYLLQLGSFGVYNSSGTN